MPEAPGYRRLEFLDAAYKDFTALPYNVRRKAGHNLSLVQEGEDPEASFKPLAGVGAGAYELRLREDTDTFRVVYVVALEHAVWVIDAFQKKSPTGRRLPRHIAERLRTRYRQAADLDATLRRR